jgi:hypothetical protein
MKQFIQKTLLIFSIFILLFIGLMVFSKYDNKDKFLSGNENIQTLISKNNFDSLDILFVGNSYAYSGIYSNMFDSIGLNVFNCGIAASGIYFYDLVINDYLLLSKSAPKNIYIVLSPMTFSPKSDDFLAYPIHRYLNKPHSNFDVALKYNLINEFVPMYSKSSRKAIQNILIKNKQSIQFNMSEKGFIPNSKIADETLLKRDKIKYSNLYKIDFDLKKAEYLFEIVKKINGNSTKVVFVELPTNLLGSCFNKNYIKCYEQLWSDISKKYKTIRVSPTLFSKVHYRDIDHLNTNGAIIATQTIIQNLK